MLSAFVITCDRAPHLVQACLHAARFADELVVVDKSPNGRTAEAMAEADWCCRAPWSPTVEATRASAVALCRGDWILSLDDDEILSPGCAEAFSKAIASNHADVFSVPIRHYVLGLHDPRCSYWPEYRNCLFRRGMVEFGPTVHSGVRITAGARHAAFALDGPAYIDHLSHENVSAWIEKTNRYTDQRDRAGIRPSGSLAEFAQNALQVRCDQVPAVNGYLEAIAVLRALYDIVDGLKRWEETQPDGTAAFRQVCDEVLAR